jgi:hypothetical protein
MVLLLRGRGFRDSRACALGSAESVDRTICDSSEQEFKAAIPEPTVGPNKSVNLAIKGFRPSGHPGAICSLDSPTIQIWVNFG